MTQTIVDLCEHGCPMALLLAKRHGQRLTSGKLVIYVKDRSAMQDIVRYFRINHFSVQLDETIHHYVLTAERM